MLEANELILQSQLTLGTLETNAEAIKQLVKAKLQDYTPENYIGKVDDAKADRALLNKAEKDLNDRRLQLEREYMAPFMTFKGLIADTCKEIKNASSVLDGIVKAEENRVKEEKRAAIEKYWESKNFTLFELSKIFDPKWLNVTTKQKNIEAAIDDRIKKTFDELKILDNFPAADIPLLKTIYLDTLDITKAMEEAEKLKANRERVAREEAERAQVLKAQQIHAQALKEKDEVNAAVQQDKNQDLIAVALEVQPEAPAIETFALVLHGTRDQLLNVRRFMTSQGVTYEKLEKNDSDGAYRLAE